MADFCEQCDWDAIKDEDYLDQLGEYQLLKVVAAAWT
jgi:hypothetical protein